MNDYHESVMVEEVLDNLHIEPGKKYIDATLGTGGHALEIMKAGGKVLGIEIDPEMLEIAKRRIHKGIFVLGNFVNIDQIAKRYGFEKVSGILFDLGVTNLHLKGEDRGFSFANPEADLDMRLDANTQAVKGSDLLNVLREDQLRELFEITLDPGVARWLARRIVDGRPFSQVGDFLRALVGMRAKREINPATLPFLALRIAVNSELNNLKEALPKAFGLLKMAGRIVVISFHSGEDRIVKEMTGGRLILPDEREVKLNPRARSAKMRVYVKN